MFLLHLLYIAFHAPIPPLPLERCRLELQNDISRGPRGGHEKDAKWVRTSKLALYPLVIPAGRIDAFLETCALNWQTCLIHSVRPACVSRAATLVESSLAYCFLKVNLYHSLCLLWWMRLIPLLSPCAGALVIWFLCLSCLCIGWPPPDVVRLQAPLLLLFFTLLLLSETIFSRVHTHLGLR